jgi:hypothetical protein
MNYLLDGACIIRTANHCDDHGPVVTHCTAARRHARTPASDDEAQCRTSRPKCRSRRTAAAQDPRNAAAAPAGSALSYEQ